MELRLTPEQSLLRDSAGKFIAAAGPKVARGFRRQNPPFAPARLRAAGDLGWLGILVPAAQGGLGLGLTELALLLEQAGQGLVCEPVGSAAISAAALSAPPHPMLKAVMSGAALVVPALQEGPHGDDPLVPRTRAQMERGALRLSGNKMFVCADGAEGFLVSAGSAQGSILCYVARDAPGCTLSATPTVEGRALALLALADAPADLISAHPSSRNAVDALHNLALFAYSCELLGVMEKAQDITLDYLRLRKQFGKPIGSFQALQHQAVNMYIRAQAVRSLVFAIAANNDPYCMDPVMAIAAKAKASEEALAVTQAAIQLHGAIGFTDEHDIGLYLKRAMLLSALLGNAAAQRRRYAEIAGLRAYI
jgi:alkylation response protein AidB-like acyl-CoA dehydrogenase